MKMKKMLAITVFTLATLAWAAAQQPGRSTQPNSGQTTSPSSQAPDATPTQPSTPGTGAQAEPPSSQGQQPGAQGQMSNAPVTEGCLGGTPPNYTITDKTGTAYKLNMPPNADTSKLPSHVGESVQVRGDVKDSGKSGESAISVQAIGRGTGTCPASGSKSTTPPPPKQ